MTVPNNTAVAYGPAPGLVSDQTAGVQGFAYGPRDVLEVAARAIERAGLYQGNPDDDPEGKLCALTGIMRAGEELQVRYTRAWHALCAHLGITDGEVFRWNDEAEDASVVTGALRAAAAGLAAAGLGR